VGFAHLFNPSVIFLTIMSYKVNVSIEKTDSGYLAYCPELSEQTFQGDSLDLIFSELKTVIQADYQHQVSSETKRKPIWEIAQDLTQDMTEDELQLLPVDGAEQHNHYIYGTPKENL
jgi:predicted RNase H-like HicB family nuclease